MKRFRKGDTVVRLSDHPQKSANNVSQGDLYTVIGTAQCPCCAQQLINVGVVATSKTLFCKKVSKHYLNNTGKWWFSSVEFSHVQNKYVRMKLTNREVLEENLVIAN